MISNNVGVDDPAVPTANAASAKPVPAWNSLICFG